MLSDAKLQTIVWTSRMSAADTFYRDVLGLRLRGRSDGALVFDVGGGDRRLDAVCGPVPNDPAKGTQGGRVGRRLGVVG